MRKLGLETQIVAWAIMLAFFGGLFLLIHPYIPYFWRGSFWGLGLR